MNIPNLDRSSRFVGLAVLALGIVAAAIGYSYQQAENTRDRQISFDHFVHDFGKTFAAKFENYRFGLLNVRRVFSDSGTTQTTSASVAAYTLWRDLESELPGLGGVGFVRRVLLTKKPSS